VKYGTYTGARFLFAGTPSGLTLCRESGAHQSFLTPLLGIGMPNLIFYEPAYAAELDVIVCWALQHLAERQHQSSVYLRLTTKALPQATVPHTAAWQRQVLAGGYWLRDYRAEGDYQHRPRVHLFATGVMMAEALTASDAALEDGIYANVINITSPERLFDGWMAHCRGESTAGYLDELLPESERHIPGVTLLDGHPLALAWLGNILHAPLRALGVTAFGESASLPDLYHKHRIDADAVLSAMTPLLFPVRK
jgi:pyruvate dehydrogenase E1 component